MNRGIPVRTGRREFERRPTSYGSARSSSRAPSQCVATSTPGRRRTQAPRRGRDEASGVEARAHHGREPPARARDGIPPPSSVSTISPAIDQLACPPPRRVDDRLQSKPLAGHRGHLGRPRPGCREVHAPEEHGIPDRLGHRDGAPSASSSPAEPLWRLSSAARAAATPRRRTATPGSDPEPPAQRRRPVPRPAPAASNSAASPSPSGPSDELAQSPGTPQLVACPSKRMIAGQLIGAIRADDQDAGLRQARGERGDQFQCRGVGPLKIVENEKRPLLTRNRDESTADRLVKRCGVDVLWPRRPTPARGRATASPRGPQPSRASGSARRWDRSAATSGPYAVVVLAGRGTGQNRHRPTRRPARSSVGSCQSRLRPPQARGRPP